MGATLTRVISCGSWPEVVQQINLMMLDNRIDDFIIEWKQPGTNIKLEDRFSITSSEVFRELTDCLGKRFASSKVFDLASGFDPDVGAESLRTLRVIVQ
jgi:hypothetical protein